MLDEKARQFWRTHSALTCKKPDFAPMRDLERLVPLQVQCRWAGLARHGGLAVAALGGIDGVCVGSLPRRLCAGAGAIGALS